jgi:hypothetical protein
MGILTATEAAWGAPIATEAGRRGLNYYQLRHNNPHLNALQQPFTTLDTEIAREQRELARATRGTPEYVRLQERVDTYNRLKLGKTKTPDGLTIAESEMGALEGGTRTAFTQAEVTRLRQLQDQERLLLAEKGEATAAWRGNPLGGIGRVTRGAAGAAGTYFFDSAVSSGLKSGGHDELAEFMAPSTLEILAVGGTMTAPVPKFVPGASGPVWARLGARALWEVGVDLGSKLVAYGYDKVTDPDVEKRHLNSAKQAQTDDHTKKTPESMNAAVDAWKVLANHDNQIQQALDETATQIGTTDPAKLTEVKRDLVALHAAFGEAWLDNGTRVGGPDFGGNVLAGSTKIHRIFEGKDFDFGGVALQNLNTARNVLNELGIYAIDPVTKKPTGDPVANRIYGSAGHGDMTRIMNPHKDLPTIYNDLKTMVEKNDPDAKWLSGWLASRVTDGKRSLAAEESAAMAAKQKGETFVPQFNNYVLAKIYQDQALLDMAYAAAGQDAPTHLKAAHDALKEAQRIGWGGRPITVGGKPAVRQSDLPELINTFKGLGGTVDW